MSQPSAERTPPRRYWCELAWLGADAAQPGVLLTLNGDRIEAVGQADTPPSGAVRLDGITIPGMANAHSHAFQRALRGRTHSASGTFWTWREQMYTLAGVIDPDSYRALARATFAEMALAGITLVGEFHYLHHGPGGVPYEDANEMGHVIIGAAEDAGIRLSLLDTCYLRGGIEEPLSAVQRRFADADADAWSARAGALAATGMARIGAAVHSVRAVDPDGIREVSDWAADRQAPLHAHVSEQAAENEQCLAAYGRTPTSVLSGQSALTPRFTAVHATHLAERDIALLGDCEATCCICPSTERDLADGIGRASFLRDAGARLALGSDSHAVIDLFDEARAMELDERLASRQRALHSPAALLAATGAGGYDSLGWPEGGRLQAGALADFTTVALDGVALAGSDPSNAAAAIVFVAGATDVRHVVVGGREIVRDGRHLQIEVAEELRQAIAALTL